MKYQLGTFHVNGRSVRPFVLCGLLLVQAACSTTTEPCDAGPSDADAPEDGMVPEDTAHPEPDDASVPEEDAELSEPPPWEPDFDLDPEVGWRDSTEPLCSEHMGLTYPTSGFNAGVDLWADSGRVAVIITADHNLLAENIPYDPGTALYVNDGTGWETWYSTPHTGVGGETRLTGVEGGPLWVWEGPCPLRRWWSATETDCVYADDRGVLHAHMVDASFGWVHMRNYIVWVHEEGHEVVADDVPGGPIWGDETGFLVLSSDGVVWEGDAEGSLTEHTVTPAGRGGAMWVHGREDLWVVTRSDDPERELMHYDAEGWSRLALPALESAGQVVGMWGTEDVLYIALSNAFYQWTDEGGLEPILEEQGFIRAIHGDVVTGEVYLLFSDEDFLFEDCGWTMVVVYDGERFRRF